MQRSRRTVILRIKRFAQVSPGQLLDVAYRRHFRQLEERRRTGGSSPYIVSLLHTLRTGSPFKNLSRRAPLKRSPKGVVPLLRCALQHTRVMTLTFFAFTLGNGILMAFSARINDPCVSPLFAPLFVSTRFTLYINCKAASKLQH